MRKNQLNLLLLVILTIAIAAEGYFSFSRVKRINKLREDIKKIKNELRGFGNYRERLKDLEDKSSLWQKKTREKEQYIFWEEDISFFIKEITNIAKLLSIEFFSIDSHPVEEVSSFPDLKIKILKIPLSISMQEDFFKLIDFLKNIENFNKFVKIENVRISTQQNDIYHHRINISISVLVKREI